MSDLGAYFIEVAGTRWNYGDKPGAKHDCCVFPSNWLVRCGYPDPMAFLRDAYASEAEALEHIRTTGLARLAARGCRAIGLRPTKAPKDGDVAVLRRPTAEGDNVTCAIRTGDRWATVIEQGLVVDEGGEVVRAWRVKWARP